MEADLYLNLAGVLVCQCEMFCPRYVSVEDLYTPPTGAATKMATDVELKLVESSFVI